MKSTLVGLYSFFTCYFLVLTVSAHAEDPAQASKPSARAIVEISLNRDDGKTQYARQSLSSCRYAIKNKKMVCAEKPRIKVLENIRKDYGAAEKDKRAISILLDPPAEKGISFLQYDYEDKEKESDQWMYLSALGKVKRIVSGNDDEPKKGSFFGSEFGYEDMEQRHIDDFTYKIVKEEVYKKRPCWVIESIPVPGYAKRSNYSKSLNWIDKERHLVLKSILYNRQGKREKRFTARQVKQVDGIWTAYAAGINNLLTKRMSQIKLEKVVYNLPVDNEFLTLRSLTDAAFRQSHIKQLKVSSKD